MLLANADRLLTNLICVDFRYLCQSCFLYLWWQCNYFHNFFFDGFNHNIIFTRNSLYWLCWYMSMYKMLYVFAQLWRCWCLFLTELRNKLNAPACMYCHRLWEKEPLTCITSCRICGHFAHLDNWWYMIVTAMLQNVLQYHNAQCRKAGFIQEIIIVVLFTCMTTT